jgi:cation transport regulator ChaC
MVNGVYREARLPVRLEDGSGEEVWAVCYVVERHHPSYAGRLALARQAALIRGTEGISGLNVDYLVSTVEHLQQAGTREPDLERLVTLVGPHLARARQKNGGVRAGRSIMAAVRLHRLDDVRRMRPTERRRFMFRIQMAKS